MARNIGQNIRRHGSVVVNTPAGGAAASAVTVTGDVSPAGSVVETAWGQSQVNAPTTGWGAATVGAGLGATWSRSTTRPAAGTWFLWARRRDWNYTTGVAQNATVVT
jgi:hypothetical protein